MQLVLPVARHMGEEGRKRFARLPALHEPEVIAGHAPHALRRPAP